MPNVANCPHCERLVSLPAGAQPEARVRCPLCRAEYALQDAIDHGPPELVLLDESASVSATIGPAGDATLEDWGPLGLGAGDRDRADSPPPEALPSIGKGVHAVEVPAVEARLSSKRQARGWRLRSAVGIVGGGVLGLALGYFILQWLPRGGREKDFLNITHLWPRFMVPPSYRNDFARIDSEEGGADRGVPARTTGDPHRTDSASFGQGTSPPEPPEPDVPSAVQPAVRPRIGGTASYAHDALPNALQAAHDARGGVIEGRLADSEVKKKKQDAYQAFCRLADVVTFAVEESGGSEVDGHKAKTEELLRYVARNERIQGEVNLLAAAHMARLGRSHNGVFLFGRVVTVRRSGTHYTTNILLAGQTRVVSLMSDTLPPCEHEDFVAVLASVVDDPKSTVVDYDGPDRRVIWLGMMVKTEP